MLRRERCRGPVPPQEEDHIGVGIFVSELCEAMNFDCDVGLARNGVGVLGSLGMFAGATQVARGRANPFLIGIGVVLFLIGLVLSQRADGRPDLLGGNRLYQRVPGGPSSALWSSFGKLRT